jgi:hypothetical protein
MWGRGLPIVEEDVAVVEVVDVLVWLVLLGVGLCADRGCGCVCVWDWRDGE